MLKENALLAARGNRTTNFKEKTLQEKQFFRQIVRKKLL